VSYCDGHFDSQFAQLSQSSYCDGHFDSQFAQLSQSLFSDSLGRPVSLAIQPGFHQNSPQLFDILSGFFIDWPKRKKKTLF